MLGDLLIGGRGGARQSRAAVGDRGAVAAAHPLAAGAGAEVLARGGSAVDAAIAAQAVLCVVIPNACSLGGDLLALVRAPDGQVTAVNGTGVWPRGADQAAASGGASVTVPGLVSGWEALRAQGARLGLDKALESAVRIAGHGPVVEADLAGALAAQRQRLLDGGAQDWELLGARPGQRVAQPVLAQTLTAIGRHGGAGFYLGGLATAVAATVQRHGGSLTAQDMAEQAPVVGPPVTVEWAGGTVAVQPPMTQGVLLAMALQWLQREGADADALDHLCVEVTEAAFAFRSRAGEGAALLRERLAVDRQRAARRGGPRSYFHTAGVAATDADGLVVSSLVSVFDDFGSACFVPEGGFTLNNRAAGFTDGPNASRPGARPVHTLAPALLQQGEDVLAIATPGADGQVQTLLQVLAGMHVLGRPLTVAVDAPRWRSDGGRLQIERSHPAAQELARRGHDLVLMDDGDERFGGVVAAGITGGVPLAVGDWRRQVATAAA